MPLDAFRRPIQKNAFNPAIKNIIDIRFRAVSIDFYEKSLLVLSKFLNQKTYPFVIDLKASSLNTIK